MTDQQTGGTDEVAKKLPRPLPVTVGKFRAVTELLERLVANTQRVFVDNEASWRAEMQAASRRPLDVKDAAQIAAAMLPEGDDGELTAKQREELLAELMARGYEVERDPQSIGVWVFAALCVAPKLLDSAVQFVLLMEMGLDEFEELTETASRFTTERLFDALAEKTREPENIRLGMSEIRERLIAAVQVASNDLLGGDASPKALAKEWLATLAQGWASVSQMRTADPNSPFLIDSQANTAGNRK